MDWHASGRRDVFRYYRVTWPDFQEAEEVTNVSDVTIDENMLSTLKVSGTATIAGGWENMDDLLRVYSVSTYGGETETVCHGTFVVVTSDDSATGSGSPTTKANLYSTLKILQDEVLSESIVLSGADPVATASSIISNRHLPVDMEAYGSKLSTAVSMDAGETLLSYINAILDAAGYGSAGVNAYGWVTMYPYTDPSSKKPVALFGESTGSAVVSPKWTRSMSASTVYNLVTMVGTDSNGNPLRSQAANTDPNSKWSSVSRGKTVSWFEEVSEATTQAALNAKAAAKLRESTTSVETVTLTHNWEPVDIGDAVTLDFPADGATGTYYLKSRKTKMTPGMPCTSEVRRTADLEGK